MYTKVGIIGFGNMGSAIAGRIKEKYSLIVFDKEKSKTPAALPIAVASDITRLLKASEAVILAVKPQDFDAVLKEMSGESDGKLIISIAAGIDTSYIAKHLGNRVGIIRAMPNIAAEIGESVTCICLGPNATADDLEFANELFYYIGTTKDMPENMMNAATAISGSGPGYIYYFLDANSIDLNTIAEHTKYDIIKRLARAAENLGFNSEDAMFLAVNTTNCSINLARASKVPLKELKDRVTSKGGTTEAGLEVLSGGGNWEEAAQAALKRAEQLSRKG